MTEKEFIEDFAGIIVSYLSGTENKKALHAIYERVTKSAFAGGYMSGLRSQNNDSFENGYEQALADCEGEHLIEPGMKR